MELLAEDKSDQNQSPPFPIKEESLLEDLVEEQDMDDLLLISVISLGGMLVILIMVLIVIFCCKCKKKRHHGQVENGNLMVLKNLQRQQKVVSDIIAKLDK